MLNCVYDYTTKVKEFSKEEINSFSEYLSKLQKLAIESKSIIITVHRKKVLSHAGK